MMNISFNEGLGEETNHLFQNPVSSYLYRDIASPASPVSKDARPPQPAATPDSEKKSAPSLSADEINNLVSAARAEGVAQTEKRLREEYEARANRETAKTQQALELFLEERKNYFSRVESEVVHLALAIAAKVLHREAQVDPLLIAALVRVAIDKLHDGSKVSVRVSPAKAERMRESMSNPLNSSTITLIEDANLEVDDCILETDLGSANFSIDAQLKEVEQGFFDLLAQRPSVK